MSLTPHPSTHQPPTYRHVHWGQHPDSLTYTLSTHLDFTNTFLLYQRLETPTHICQVCVLCNSHFQALCIPVSFSGLSMFTLLFICLAIVYIYSWHLADVKFHAVFSSPDPCMFISYISVSIVWPLKIIVYLHLHPQPIPDSKSTNFRITYLIFKLYFFFN